MKQVSDNDMRGEQDDELMGLSGAEEAEDEELPSELRLDMWLRDREVIEAVSAYATPRERQAFVTTALRIGVLAMRQASGQVDATSVRNEGERMLTQLAASLTQHKETVAEQVSHQLKVYFDPNDGHFNERIKRLVARDGELESTLRALIGREDSELVKTLGAHIGDRSPLMKLLDPNEADGMVAALEGRVATVLEAQRERILRQFSLDDDASALSRLVQQIKGNNAEVVREFSLDHEDSALSRLMRGVQDAQTQISREFSLDEEDSALARMKKQMLDVLEQHRTERKNFEVEVRTALKEMQARKEERAKSTRHGAEFEASVAAQVRELCRPLNDVVHDTGNTPGRIKNSKVGDCVVEFGPEHVASGAKVVLEAKQDRSYDLKKALAEIEVARNNREAQAGIFVFSSKTAPAGTEPMRAYGTDLVVVWDAEDPETDIVLDAALFAARSIAAAIFASRSGDQADIGVVETAILGIQKQLGSLEDISKWVGTIKSNSEKIENKARIMRDKLSKEITLAQEGVDAIRRG